MKKLWKCTMLKVWTIVAPIVIALFLVINILAYSVFYELFNLVMPGGGLRAVYKPGTEPAYETKYTSKQSVYDAAREMNREI